MWRRWLTSWRNWTGDHGLDTAIRAQMEAQGYGDRQACIRNCRLVAIERPGWVQVFQFEVSWPADDSSPDKLYGVARDDGRSSTTVKLYSERRQRNEQRDLWSLGLIEAPHKC